MEEKNHTSPFKKIKSLIVGKARSAEDPQLFHKLSLVVFFAWIGLGVDGLSSSCYGPEEAFLALKTHIYLGIFVALASVATILIISASYSQIVELFPHGGGGYLVASKLLSPSLGMISGCALLVDYILTITLSVASGIDALFSFLPGQWASLKLGCAVGGVIILILLNLRGIKESVLPLVPIFLVFIITHAIAILYALTVHLGDAVKLSQTIGSEIHSSTMELGVMGVILLILRAYSMGAGTYTGIEAVSNGIPILREPKVQTAQKTIRYMAFSLSFMAMGLMLGYLLYRVQYQPGKTLNAVLLQSITAQWPVKIGAAFVLIALFSEAVLLFIAAQTGFLDGPRVLANMALDRWFPTQFAILSERFVTEKGILLMGIAACVLMVISHGSVKFLVVLYSINVFITFLLSQLGMVRHWWNERKTSKAWMKKILINGVGLVATIFILVSMVILKFHDGGWITLFITGSLVILAILVKRHYKKTLFMLRRLNALMSAAEVSPAHAEKKGPEKLNPGAKTAVVFVSGYNGLGLHTLFNVLRLFKDNFKNFIFVEVGVIDAGNFKGTHDIEKLKSHVQHELSRYVTFMQSQGFAAEGVWQVGSDMMSEISEISQGIIERYPQAVFFGGQMVFAQETFFTRLLHNYTTFAVQKRLYQAGIPFLILPIRVD